MIRYKSHLTVPMKKSDFDKNKKKRLGKKMKKAGAKRRDIALIKFVWHNAKLNNITDWHAEQILNQFHQERFKDDEK